MADPRHVAADILEAPRYAAAEAARLIGVTASRARRWWRGYTFNYELPNGTARDGRSGPVTRAQAAHQPRYMCFLDLMDLLLVKRMRDQGLSLQKVRCHFREVQARTGERHLARLRFFVWAQSVFLDETPGAPMLLELGASGQTVFRGVTEKVAEEVDVESESLRPLRWYPPGRDQRIVVDPAVVFGQPHLAGHRRSTEVIYDLYKAESGGASAVADWYAIGQDEVMAAVDFHAALVA
jgi:uncharacterized protein (DUF433 family)